MVEEEIRLEREAVLAQLASAYQRRDLDEFEKAVRLDMTLTLAGSSRLAGTYEGYAAFGRYLEILRESMRSAGQAITFEHDQDQMVFRQVMIVSGGTQSVEMTLVVTVRYDEGGKIESFLVKPENQALFDRVIDAGRAQVEPE